MLEIESPPPSPQQGTRPAAITASAVIALLGSALALSFAGLIIVALFAVREQLANQRVVALGIAVFVGGLGALGIATAIGLLRLRPWARISILIFAGIMAVLGFLSAALMSFAPIPAPPNPSMSASAMRTFLVIAYVIPGVIGIWWLVLFNRRATRDFFVSGALPASSSRVPPSILIIGWWMLIGGIVSLIPAVIGTPALIAGMILEGWSARLVYIAFTAIGIYLGWGLLKLHERARVLAIGWFGLAFLHSAYAATSPTARTRMREMEGAMGGAAAQQSPVSVPSGDTSGLTVAMLVLTMVLIVVGVWFLARNKGAFQRNQARAVPTGPPV
jgi:hypothetical protein